MEQWAQLAAGFAAFGMLVHLATVVSAAWRCRRFLRTPQPLGNGPSVSIIRPLCGVDAYERETLRSTFQLDYPRLEILLCVASQDDPVIALARQIMAEHPHVDAHLLIGEDRVSANPKLNNVIKGWRAARHGWIAIVDSNVLMPCDYMQRLLATWRPDTGLVTAPPIGSRPANVWAEFECAFLNTYQARWQIAADTLGYGFAQGKTLFWRRVDLEHAGGIQALGAEIAEDAASTKVVRGQGKRVHLVDGAFPQPLGVRALAHVWGRQLRWARLRRATFPLVYALEIFSGLAAPTLAAVFAAWVFDCEPLITGLLLVATWVAAECALALAAGWHLSWRAPLLYLLRDLSLPVLWVQSWKSGGVSWRGTEFSASSVPAKGWGAWLRGT